MGTLRQFAQDMAESFHALRPAEQDQVRRQIYERVTGKAYRSDASRSHEEG